MKNPFAFVLATFFCINSYGTHLRGGEISATQLDKNSLTVRITITVFTNTENTSVLFGGEDDWLDFGDGIRMLVPTTPNTLLPDLGPGMATASFTVLHTYPSHGAYLISFSEPNRNEGVLNMENSVNTRFYVESKITLMPDRIYETPKFLSEPIFLGIIGQTFTSSIACQDKNDYTLFYKIVTPRQDINKDVVNYLLPATFSLNTFNGLVTWDTKFKDSYQVGEFVFTVKVLQVDSDNKVIGYVIRDFQIILNDVELSASLEDNKDLDSNNRLYVPENESIHLKILGSSTDGNQISLTPYSELFNIPGATEIETYDSVSGSRTYRVSLLKINNLPEISRNNPYVICFRMCLQLSYGKLFKDINYLFYSRDVELKEASPPSPVDPVVTEITKELGEQISIFPNPVQNYLHLDLPEHKKVNLTILDLSGKPVSFKRSNNTVDLSQVNPGIYLLKIDYNGQETRTVKIIKY